MKHQTHAGSPASPDGGPPEDPYTLKRRKHTEYLALLSGGPLQHPCAWEHAKRPDPLAPLLGKRSRLPHPSPFPHWAMLSPDGNKFLMPRPAAAANWMPVSRKHTAALSRGSPSHPTPIITNVCQSRQSPVFDVQQSPCRTPGVMTCFPIGSPLPSWAVQQPCNTSKFSAGVQITQECRSPDGTQLHQTLNCRSWAMQQPDGSQLYQPLSETAGHAGAQAPCRLISSPRRQPICLTC